jgi:hypothetical protein
MIKSPKLPDRPGALGGTVHHFQNEGNATIWRGTFSAEDKISALMPAEQLPKRK